MITSTAEQQNYLTNRRGSEISVTSVIGETSKRAAARGIMFFPNEPEVVITCEYPPFCWTNWTSLAQGSARGWLNSSESATSTYKQQQLSHTNIKNPFFDDPIILRVANQFAKQKAHQNKINYHTWICHKQHKDANFNNINCSNSNNV